MYVTLSRVLADSGYTGGSLRLFRRTPLPVRSEWARWPEKCDTADWIGVAIRTIEAAGGEVMVTAAYASDVGAMSRANDRDRLRWSALNGVILAAGIPRSGNIAFLKRREELRAVCAPKLGGLLAIMKLLGNVPPRMDPRALFLQDLRQVAAAGRFGNGCLRA